MASNYPAALDTTATLPAAGGVGANLSTFPHSAHHGNANDAIIAIETELGTAPSGTLSTVKARLDKIAPYTGALTSYTPVLFQNGVIANTNNYSRWQRNGRLISGWFYITSTTTLGFSPFEITVSLPVAAAQAGAIIGVGTLTDVSPTPDRTYKGMLQVHTTGTDVTIKNVASSVEDDRLGINDFAVPIASGDFLRGQFVYEAAAD